jgi:hypothetical protein
MEADYTKKSDLSATESNLKTEISKSAAGLRTEVSQTYSTKKELETTTKAAQTAQSTADAAKKAAESNASDLANAVSKFDGDITNLKDQIDGAIQTWFYDGIPNALTEPEVNWTTDKDRQTHLGDLYYDNQTGFCYRYMNQNGVYSWGRIQDTEVTKALADAANAQTTANAKKRIFITTPKPPYDIGDLWVQGSNGDIMRCQTPKLDSQAYAEADWVKASKYTDDTAVTNLSNTVKKTYATKSTVDQLSDRIEQTVSSVEEVRTDASAAKTTADNAQKAANDAAAAANTAHETATAAQTAANKAQEHATSAATAASTAKANADAAQAAANKANAALSDAQTHLTDLQNRADVTDEELTAAKNAVASAQTAADAANSAASKAKELANTAQSTANTAKQNAATAQSKANAAANAASAAQSTADTAKANAKKAQDDVDALKNRVTQAETKITQNSEAIALRATKTEVTNAINNVNVGGSNLLTKTANSSITTIKAVESTNGASYGMATERFQAAAGKLVTISCEVEMVDFVYSRRVGTEFSHGNSYHGVFFTAGADGSTKNNLRKRIYRTFTLPSEASSWTDFIECNCFIQGAISGKCTVRNPKLELGNKSTDWSPAPEDLQADAANKANNALTESRKYTDAQLKITSDSITSAVSKTYQTKTDMQKYPTVNQTAVRYVFLGTKPANSGKWIKLGIWTSSGDSQCCSIQVFTGNGYNGLASQNSDFLIFIKDGHQRTPSASTAFGVTVTLGLNCANVKVQVRAKSSTVCDVWFYCPWNYGTGSYIVDRGSGKWEHSGLNQTAEPTDGTSQNIFMAGYLTSEETHSAINQRADQISSIVAATYVNNETLSSYATKSQLEQTSTSLTSRIQTTETTVSGMSTTVKNVNDYMTFARENNHPTLTIGSSSSSFRTKLTNTSEKFMQGDQTIMALDGVTSTVKASRVQMGHYQWRDTGTSMQLVYIP